MSRVAMIMVALVLTLTARPTPAQTRGVGSGQWPSWMPRVEPEHHEGYNGGSWGGWYQFSRCAGMRDYILAETSTIPATLGPDHCTVLAGRWIDAYTGDTLRSPANIDIDHIVSIQEMHASGGWAWSADQKRAAYNDTFNLAVVAKRVMDAKKGKDVTYWLPADPTSRCAFLERYLAVKARYGLSVDVREARVLTLVSRACGDAEPRGRRRGP